SRIRRARHRRRGPRAGVLFAAATTALRLLRRRAPDAGASGDCLRRDVLRTKMPTRTRALPITLLMTLSVAAGCARLIGADFDRGPPDGASKGLDAAAGAGADSTGGDHTDS